MIRAMTKTRSNASLKTLAENANWDYLRAEAQLQKSREEKHWNEADSSHEQTLRELSRTHRHYADHLSRLAGIEVFESYQDFRAHYSTN